MFLMFFSLSLCFTSLVGVFGDEVKSVSVMEGDSLTLHTDTEILSAHQILWRFETDGTLIAKINKDTNKTSIYDDVLDGRFRDRLQVNNQTGDLTITNITTQHTGLYQLTISSRQTTSHTFKVTVYARPPVPDIRALTLIVICCAVVGSLMIVASVLTFWIWKLRNTLQLVQTREEEITYADPIFSKRAANKPGSENEVVYARVNR
ncbi:uncharacterized protein [Paramisgurnus dabryanus]|uniref:uncharacterized protein n=1 Tax=Paramisgurnus dabryanus TaxID=90735 RepID=UPI0031F3C4DD